MGFSTLLLLQMRDISFEEDTDNTPLHLFINFPSNRTDSSKAIRAQLI